MIFEEPHRPMTDEPSLMIEQEEQATVAVAGEDLELMKMDVVAMTSLLRSLSLALVVQSAQLWLKEEGEEEEEGEKKGPSAPPMSPEDLTPYV